MNYGAFLTIKFGPLITYEVEGICVTCDDVLSSVTCGSSKQDYL